MPEFTTVTEVPLVVALTTEHRNGKPWYRVTITGEVTKVLLDWTDEKKAADAEYDYVKKHYDTRKSEREKGMAEPGSVEDKERKAREMEAAVAFVPRKWRRG